MPVSVSRIAPSPAQPGRPVFSTIRHAIQAARMVATRAKALVSPKKPIRAAISTPIAQRLAVDASPFGQSLKASTAMTIIQPITGTR